MVSLGLWPAMPFLRTEALLQLHHLYRLLLNLIKRMRLIFDLMEINAHQVYASDVAVPRSPVIELHCSLVCDSRKLGGTRKILRNIRLQMLAAYRNIEVVQDMECLYYSLETGRPYR